MKALGLVFKPTFWFLDCPYLELFSSEPMIKPCHLKTCQEVIGHGKKRENSGSGSILFTIKALGNFGRKIKKEVQFCERTNPRNFYSTLGFCGFLGLVDPLALIHSISPLFYGRLQ